MEALLSASEVVRIVDQAGNRDGTAALEDIQPHLDADQKIFLNASGEAQAGDAKFRQALWTLNRICGRNVEVFHLPSLLGCPVFQNGKIEAASLKAAGTSHVLSLFEKAFRNNNTDALTAERYKEFLDFIKKNGVPLHELYNILANNNLFSVPIEQVVEKGAFFAADQKTCLFQLNLYAAMWHLKHNVKAFAPEELTKYPEWFRKKVEGFEDNILGRLKTWELSAGIAIENENFMSFNQSTRKIETSATNPAPSILKSALIAIWHELFHAFRATQVEVEPRWICERDADFVAAIGFFKMAGITKEKDPRIEGALRGFLDNLYTRLGNRNPAAARERRELDFKMYLPKYLYALHLYRRGEKGMSRLRQSMERAAVEHMLLTVPLDPRPGLGKISDLEEARKFLLYQKKIAEEKMREIENRTYPSSPGSEDNREIKFVAMLGVVNHFFQSRSEGMSREEFIKMMGPYMQDIGAYMTLLIKLDQCDTWLGNINSGLAVDHWPPISPRDLPRFRRFIENNKWIVPVLY